MKKTLVMCGRYPLPDNIGTSIRTMNFVRYFKKHGSVDLAYSELPPGIESGYPIFSNEYLLEMKAYPRDFIARARAVLRGRPYPMRQYSNNSEKLLSSIIKSNDYDYILLRYIDRAYFFFNTPGKLKKKVILDVDDIVSSPSLYKTLFETTKNPYKRAIINMNRGFLMRYERKCFGLNVSVFCSESNRRNVNGDSGNATVVPNIYSNKSFEDYDFEDGFERENIFLFVGALLYRPNIEGLRWFIDTIFKAFRKERHDAKLLVVGLSPTEDVVRLCEETEGVELYGNVPDVKEYYKRCKAVVVPVLQGAGTRIKILEAALASRPVFSTPLGAEGIDLIDGKDLLLFRDAKDFSLRFKEILDRDRYHSLASNAKEFVLTNYSARNFDEAMNRVLEMIDQRAL